MPLKQSGPNYEDQTGTSETITIQPVAPNTTTDVVFTSATYGTKSDKTPQTLAGADGTTSITFKVLQGLNKLDFDLASPAPQLHSVNITQGKTLLSTVSVDSHTGVGSLRIMGTAAVVAAGGHS